MLMKGWQGTREEWDVSEEIYENAACLTFISSIQMKLELYIDLYFWSQYHRITINMYWPWPWRILYFT